MKVNEKCNRALPQVCISEIIPVSGHPDADLVAML